MPNAHASAARPGFTLLEIIVSMSLLLMVLGAAVPFLIVQTRTMASHAGRHDAQQNAMFGVEEIERELRAGGTGAVSTQPLIVQAAVDALTFNVDLVSRVSRTDGAVYFDPDADSATTLALRPADVVTLPNSGWTYPNVLHAQPSGLPSGAETISYWVEPDSVAGRARLMRRVNAAPAQPVASGLVLPPGEPVFRYFAVDSVGTLYEVPAALLPLRHVQDLHGAANDTGADALVDRIRVVRVRLTAAFVDREQGELRRRAQRTVRIHNAGLVRHSTCGDPPLFGAAAVAVPSLPGDPPAATLTFSAASDEGGGERDVMRYAVYRRQPSDPAFGEPIASIAAGLPTYSFTDTDVRSGESWIYAVVAQDCTPATSTQSVSNPVIIP
jgi:prepilin-type N-terminal cleavage/methylation domain-containing protein